MSKTPFMPLWVGNFLADTQELNGQEVGAYLLLLMSLWQRGGTLPNDQKKLQRVARIDRGWPNVWASIRGYFTVTDEAISNDRLTLELTEARTKSTINSKAGALGGLAKARKYKGVGLANATISPKQSESESESEKKEEESVEIARKRAPRTRASPKTRIPTDAVISAEMTDIAEKEGLSPIEATAQFMRFRDRALSKGEAYADWNAAWRYWITGPYYRPITGNVHQLTRSQSNDERLDAPFNALKARLAVQRLE